MSADPLDTVVEKLERVAAELRSSSAPPDQLRLA